MCDLLGRLAAVTNTRGSVVTRQSGSPPDLGQAAPGTYPSVSFSSGVIPGSRLLMCDLLGRLGAVRIHEAAL